MEQSSTGQQQSNESCKNETVAIPDRYINHLYDSIKKDFEEICALCQLNKDVNQIKRLQSLFQNCVLELTALVQYLNINNEIGTTENNVAEGLQNADICGANLRLPSATNRSTGNIADGFRGTIKKRQYLNKPSSSSNRNLSSDTYSPMGHNVDAPCFVPLRSSADPDCTHVNSLTGDFDPTIQRPDLLRDGVPLINQNFWHVPTFLHSQIHLPHFHVSCSPNAAPFTSISSLGNYSSLILPDGLHGNGFPFHLQLSPFNHYPGMVQLQQSPEPDAHDHHKNCRRHEPRSHSHLRNKSFAVSPDRTKISNTSSASTEMKNECIYEQDPNVNVINFKVEKNLLQDASLAEKTSELSPTPNVNSQLESGPKPLALPENGIITPNFTEPASDKRQMNSKESINLISNISSTEDTFVRENLQTPERLREFPELSKSFSRSGNNISRKARARLPRVKFQKKTKISISELYKTFTSPHMDVMAKNRVTNGVPRPKGSVEREKKSKTKVFLRPQCCCSSKMNLFTHRPPVLENHQDDTSDEGDGWKKVKPRIRNRDTVKVRSALRKELFKTQACQVCQSKFPRAFEANRPAKTMSVGQEIRYTPPRYGAQSACGKRTIESRLLDYRHVFIPQSFAHSGKNIGKCAPINARRERGLTSSCEKINLGINMRAYDETHALSSEKRLPSFESLEDVPGETQSLFQHVLINSQNQESKHSFQLFEENIHSLANPENLEMTPDLIPASPLKCEENTIISNQDTTMSTSTENLYCISINSSTNDDPQISMDSPTTEDQQISLDSPTIDDHQISPFSPTNEDSTVNEENSLNEDNTEIDSQPVIEDAQEMHEEFMKYLNWSTWPTQMDEIDKFESMIACNNPSDPVLMYPSVSLEQFQEFIQRHPDEAQAFRREIIFKLRKIKETESKQQQAYEKRLQLLQCKTAKVRGFVQKVEDVKVAQNKLAMERKHQIDEKLRKAEENRKNYLSIIRRKAHDEEEKLKEIAFINELEAQNRRHDSLALRQEHEERLQGIIDERLRKVEEKAAKEAAVEERRRILEAERREKLRKIAEQRKKKEETIDRKQQERENQRLVTAREKAREREERLMARHAAQLATAEELQKRIQQKQQESARRHEENIELIRQRALEIGLHRNPEDPATSNVISKCEELLRVDSEATADVHKEKLKSLKKKRCRKLRARMTSRALEYLKDFLIGEPQTFWYSDILRVIKRETSICNATDSVRSITILKDRLTRTLKHEPNVFEKFSKSGGFAILIDILKLYSNNSWAALSKQHIILFASIVQIFHLSLTQGKNWEYFILSNDIMFLLDSLRFSITQIKTSSKSWAKISDMLLQSLITTLHHVSEMKETSGELVLIINSRMSDVVSYIINSGLVDKIILLFQDAVIDDNCDHMGMIPNCVNFFTSLISPRYRCPELMKTLVSSECFGTIPLLYEGLQKMASSDKLPVYIVPIVDLLLEFAELDVILFQDTLGDDGMALQIRAIASNLMHFCKGKPQDKLLLSVIQLVGYFAIRNVKNQTLLQSGQQPTVLQQLVTLPFIFFCDETYKDYLFPTLFVCSYNNATNKAIVENELNFCYLEDYVNEERGKANKMVKLFADMKVKV